MDGKPVQSNLLQDLTTLALEPSGEKRRDLLRALTDLFQSGSNDAKLANQDLFGDVVTRVIDQVTVEIRAEVSERLSHESLSPRDLMFKLAQDEISVASPVLQNSEALTEHDLKTIAENHSQDHLLAISNRATLSEVITDVLVQRGNTGVLHSVTRNQGARFSDSGFDTLAARAIDDRQLQANLVDRQDLPQKTARQLVPFLEDELKEKLGTIASSAASNDINDLARATALRVEDELKRAQQSRLELRVIISEIRQGTRQLDPMIQTLCEDNRALDIAMLLRELADLKEVDVSRVMFREEAGPIAVLCRYLSVSSEAFHAIAKLRCKRLKRPLIEARQELGLYEKLSETDAQRAIRFLKVRNAVAS